MIFDTLEKLEMYIPVLPKLRAVIDAMDHDDIYSKPRGKYTTPDDSVTYEVSEYLTVAADRPFEFHKKHTYVEIVLSGQELMSTTWRELKDQAQVFDAKTDTGYFTAEPVTVLQAAQGRFAVFFSGEPFKTACAAGEVLPVKKVVFIIDD
ncbi:MAG: YhcH/YjgK/YiaL family protein [Sphaerochaetaceae bacterium]|nr:YhcH/YjgK/YiaL family protein [Sphaerochaetaceae bacterium]